MTFSFYKYQGTGNDFILIDNRKGQVKLEKEEVARLCHRRFGIGADGLILLETEPGVDFRMIYYNADGNTSSLCGNGSRCMVAYAKHLGLVTNKARFMASDGLHEAMISEDGKIAVKMQDVKNVESHDGHFFLDTGSPHYVKMVAGVDKYDVAGEGRRIRNSERFAEEGTNVNFLEKTDEGLFVRTYERGVEDETYSCGTGVTASALVAAMNGLSTGRNSCLVNTLGGQLEVTFEKVLEHNFYNIWLKGPAELVFTGEIQI